MLDILNRKFGFCLDVFLCFIQYFPKGKDVFQANEILEII